MGDKRNTLCGLMGGLGPILSPRLISKGGQFVFKLRTSSGGSCKGSTSIGVPKVSSTSSGKVMGGMYTSNDGRTYGVLGKNYSFTEQVNNSATLCLLSPHRDKGTVPGPQDPERNIQLAGTGLPFTLDEETCKSQPLPKGTKYDPKGSVGNKQPIDKGLPSMVSDQGVAKTTLLPEGPLRDKDSWGNKTPADMEAINPTVADILRTSAKYQVDETQSTRLRYQTLTKNKGKTSFKGEPDLETLALTNLADIQAYLLSKDELAQESDEEEVFAAGDDVSHDFIKVVVIQYSRALCNLS
nr:hypothetical protein [Tanacetum cinerariifolium]